jgi:putative addiction module CopG family antidote
MQIRLSPESAKFVQRMIATGRFKNAADVVRAWIRLLADQERRWKADTRRKIAAGLKQLRAGKLVDGEKAVAKILRDLRRRHA